MAAVLCRRLLLAEPTHFRATRVAAASFPTPPIHLLRTRIDAASPPTPPAHFLLTRVGAASLPALDPHCPTVPSSTLPAPSVSARSRSPSSPPPPTRSAASTSSCISLFSPVAHKLGARSSRTPPSSPPAALGARSSRTPPSPPSALGARSSRPPLRPSPPLLAPHLNSGSHGIRHHSTGKVERRAQPKSPFLLLRRAFSDQNLSPSRPPPVSQLAFRDDSQISEEEWVGLPEYLKHHSLVEDARLNHLNLEMPRFGEKPRYNLSEDSGVPLFQNLVLLALANNNRGYCTKGSFTQNNILVCPRLKQIRFKSVIFEHLELGNRDCNRAATYAAVGKLIRKLLIATVGADVISQLLAEPRDLLSKLERPSDERLIVYHPAFLSMDGRIWYYQKMYRLVFKVFPFLHGRDRTNADDAVAKMAYTQGNLLVTDIIKSHPLFCHIESTAPTDPDETTKGPGDKGRREKEKRGRKIVALHRRTLEHAFDKRAKLVQSNQVYHKTLWPYSLGQVVNFLKSVMPLYLLKSQELFLFFNVWKQLNIDSFWFRNLTWIGGVPAPSDEEQAAIKKAGPYGKRRQHSRKYDQQTQRQDS